MSIQNALNTAIYSRLTGGTALTSLLAGTTSCYYIQAPNNATLPFVVWDIVDDPDTNYTANRNVVALVFARGYATSPALAGSIDAAIYTEMMRGLSVSGWTEFWKGREEGFHVVETDQAGINVYMAGAHYRLKFDKN
jgi:hypothetical protein